MAERGLLTCVPAGEAASVERIKPYLVGVVGMAVVDLSGEEPGNASLLKMIGNVLILSTMETVAELHVFAEKTGLGTPSMAKLLSTLFPRGPHTVYSGKMLGGEYHQGQVCYVR
jgi:3-hydroxyisobutyrate dehydrogenase-like beta-hydroxyacid dehydrogenase